MIPKMIQRHEESVLLLQKAFHRFFAEHGRTPNCLIVHPEHWLAYNELAKTFLGLPIIVIDRDDIHIGILESVKK